MNFPGHACDGNVTDIELQEIKQPLLQLAYSFGCKLLFCHLFKTVFTFSETSESLWLSKDLDLEFHICLSLASQGQLITKKYEFPEV